MGKKTLHNTGTQADKRICVGKPSESPKILQAYSYSNLLFFYDAIIISKGLKATSANMDMRMLRLHWHISFKTLVFIKRSPACFFPVAGSKALLWEILGPLLFFFKKNLSGNDHDKWGKEGGKGLPGLHLGRLI